jgi:S1-C subfamily serine protease
MILRIRVSLASSLILLIAAVVQAQTPLKVERSKVFARAGFVMPYLQQLPIGKGIGLVAELPVNRTGTQTLRLHFNASSTNQSPTWAIRIVEDNPARRLLWSFSSSEAEHSDFWSDELRSNAVRVEIHSTQENNPLLLSIDRMIVDGSQAAPQAITPPNDLEKWGLQGAQRRAWGKSVARIRFVSDDDGESYFCTGFLVSPDVIMTNHHCIKTQREARSANVDFDYDFEFAPTDTIRGKELLLPSNPELDFALVRLRNPVDATARVPFKLVADLPTSGQQLLVIQHPGGEPKQISVTGCVVKGIGVKGSGEKLSDFEHGCDTKGGSSGAAALNVAGNVIGLHHLGFRENDPHPDKPELLNRAVLMKEIIDFLRQKGITELNAALGIQ